MAEAHSFFLAAGSAMGAPLAAHAALAMPAVALANTREEAQSTVSRAAAPMRLLVVEDDPPVRHACAEIASSLGYVVDTADSVPAARNILKRHPVDILLLDLKLPGAGGFSLLEEVHESQPRLTAVVMTAFATVNSAVEAMRSGAGDYLPKPFTVDELTAVLERAAERRNAFDETRALRERLRSGKASGLLFGDSAPMQKLFRMVSKVAYTGHPVLILGEHGTGKELVARAIHANGPHAARPFLPVDCSSLVPAMLEGELFGYSTGAYPGNTSKPGLLSAAGRGTVFLDEVAELPLDLQARLLRCLHDREVRPIGSSAAQPLEARVLAATNRDLAAMVETGRFRKDLFYRLNVVNIRVPPLRERSSDIPALAAYLIERTGRERGTEYSFSDEALRAMVDYHWPGNLRELEHTIERTCALSSGPVVHLADLPLELRDSRFQHRAAPTPFVADDSAMDDPPVIPIFELEKQAILSTLRQLNGDKLRTARLLGIGKTTLYRKLKEYGVQEDELSA